MTEDTNAAPPTVETGDTAAAAPAVEGRKRPKGSSSLARRRYGSALRGLLPLAVLLGLWELLGSPQSPLFPNPSSWVDALQDLLEAGRLGPGVIATLRTFGVGFVSATLLGATLGILVGGSRLADRALNPTFEFARAMPPAAMVPVATLLLGFDEAMKVTVVTIAAIWPVLLNTRAAAQGFDGTMLDTARTLRLGWFARLRKVVIPAMFPAILLGVRVGAPIAVVITLLVEILTQVNGVGALVADSQRTFRASRVYGLIAVAGLISLGVHAVVGRLESYLFRYRSTS